ncbi:hypothetical protein GQ457_01G043730 [Hibiscus cannabinus]
MDLIWKKSFIGISYEEHKRRHHLTTAPVNGHEAHPIHRGGRSKLWRGSNYGVRVMTINIPGFAYHKAHKMRISRIFLACEVNSLVLIRDDIEMHFRFLQTRENLVETFQPVGNERSTQSHESSGPTTMWATVFLQQHPQSSKNSKGGIYDLDVEEQERHAHEEKAMYINEVD